MFICRRLFSMQDWNRCFWVLLSWKRLEYHLVIISLWLNNRLYILFLRSASTSLALRFVFYEGKSTKKASPPVPLLREKGVECKKNTQKPWIYGGKQFPLFQRFGYRWAWHKKHCTACWMSLIKMFFNYFVGCVRKKMYFCKMNGIVWTETTSFFAYEIFNHSSCL